MNKFDNKLRVCEWVLCDERLPDACSGTEELEVIVSLYEPYSETVITDTGFALFYPDTKTFHSVYGDKLDITDIVKAWMPRPKPYKSK